MKHDVLIVCATIVATTGVAWAAAAVHVVDQSKLQFSVAELTIHQGDTVRFTNSDRPAHNILVTDGKKILNSGLQQPGEPWEVPFPNKGRFPITCGIHPKMKMTIIVE